MPIKQIIQDSSTSIVETGANALSTTTTNGALESTQLKGIPKAAVLGQVWPIPVSGSQSCHTDFLTADKTALVTAISASSVFELTGSPYQPVWYRFSTLRSGGEVINGYVTGTFSSMPVTNPGICLHQGFTKSLIIPVGTNGLILSGTNADYVTLSIS